ncbi:SprT-like domain-containing protein [Curtobacterium sp. MCSS17_016]|uniref:SprT-like domain-containing protein n=1 Tax=Curtobacterium sp. MCSS17_016 TaxID=2175644 RepID=UPI000DA8494C|nr:SprT-like domain-containing protein [Curtobacterium sp. MCSS17_016]WIE81259.1 SprT-like domain-containing protein [Curtobacterium sp. MCSS17_016]
MDLTAARTLAETLIEKHISHKGYTFEFDRAQQRLGACHYRTKTITMSPAFVESADEYAVEQVVLHEIAHVVAGSAAKHGPVWKSVAASLGYKGGTTGHNPAHAAKRDEAVAKALSQVEAMQDRTEGEFLAGERVRIGSHEGIFIEKKNTRAHIWDQRSERLFAARLVELARVNGDGKSAKETERDALLKKAIAASKRTGLRTDGAILVGEHVRPAELYKQFTGLLIEVQPSKRRGGDKTAVIIRDVTGEGIRMPYKHIFRAPGAFQPKVDVQVGATIEPDDKVIIVKPRSKYNGVTGTIEREAGEAGQSWRIRLDNNAGILTAPKSLVRKVA